jgi:SAM-dependent methyltransferase
MASAQPLRSATDPAPANQPPAAGNALFEHFLAEVSRAALDAWLPPMPTLILDLSHHYAQLVGLMVARGHTVVHGDPQAMRPEIGPADGHLVAVRGDTRRLDWLAEGAVDAVVAEGGTLSEALAAELTIEDLHRVLRPGGRLLLCVESLVSGLARLAEQGRWAELADVPAADVVLVPAPDGSVMRCFWPEELHAMLGDAGFSVEWVRPRTVLSEQTVVHALRVDPGQLDSLVATELALSRRRQGESIGAQLVASAVRLPA